MDRVKALWEQVFGPCGGFWDTFFQAAYDPEHCLFLEEDGQVAAALFWFDCDCGGPWAYLFAVATHPGYRGRGLCRQLMDRTHAHLAVQGYHGALLVPAEPGLRRMYEKMGYREGTAIGEYTMPPGLRPLSAGEYAAARRMRLPPGGVIQEGAMLNLLDKLGVRFFEGEDGIFAAEEARVLEYLGPSAPGKQKPFAMVRPFRQDAVIPQYFAFALD